MTLFFALYLCLLYFIYPTIYGRRAQGTGGGDVQMRQNNVSLQSEVVIELVQVTELRRAGRPQIRLFRTASNRRTSNGHGDLKP